ncbi:MAG: DUF5597 domain-containing protein, partial [Prevotella sp.]|nr:DUF5597 domain-containing protein [Prevotella sp.]
IDRARENHLQVVFLWFGAWKNSMSCYAPAWFKTDTKRFPRATTRTGKPLEIASAFSEEVFKADCRAFTQLMEHLAAKDKGVGTISMIQIENEIGMLEDARDHSTLAEKAYRQPVPDKLLKALKLKKRGTWAEVFGTDDYADEKFMAWHYALYVERLAQVARRIYDVPLYVNAAMNSRGRKPGEYPSAGPLAHLATIWQTAAPSIDLLAPDIYDTGFKSWASQYDLSGNRLFIPESRCCVNSGVRALYAFGEHRALGFSPFAIDQAASSETQHVTQAYQLLRQMKPFLRSLSVKSWGLLFDQQDKERVIEDDGLVLTCRHNFTLPWDPRATDGSEWPEGGATVVKLRKGEYLIAGNGVVVEFKTKSEKEQEQQKRLGEDGFVLADGSQSAATSQNTASVSMRTFRGKRCGIVSVDQVTIDEKGNMKFVRRDNGDQDHQGRHARIGVGEYKILHVKLYEY